MSVILGAIKGAVYLGIVMLIARFCGVGKDDADK